MKQTRIRADHVLIAGGGASGMCAAVLLARKGLRVTVLEKGPEAGKKLSMTGNGRCNLSNLYLDETCYETDDRKLLGRLLARFGAAETVSFFRSVGVPVRSEEGYLYPVSGEARSVAGALLHHMKKEGVMLRTGEQLKKIVPDERSFRIETTKDTFVADTVVLSSGGMSGPKSTCSDGDGYYLAKSLGLRVSDPYPALCRLLSDDPSLPGKAGVRVTATIRFLADDALLAEETGEVQLTKNALSGIPVLQASASCAQALARGKRVRALLDLFPFSSKEETDALIKERIRARGTESVREFLNGFVHSLIIEMILEREAIDPDSAISAYPARTLTKLLQRSRALEIPVSAADTFRQAQATRGGVCLSGLNDHLEAGGVPGLYVIGELCNVDGRCGGYNLQWAWTSAMAASEGISGKR